MTSARRGSLTINRSGVVAQHLQSNRGIRHGRTCPDGDRAGWLAQLDLLTSSWSGWRCCVSVENAWPTAEPSSRRFTLLKPVHGIEPQLRDSQMAKEHSPN